MTNIIREAQTTVTFWATLTVLTLFLFMHVLPQTMQQPAFQPLPELNLDTSVACHSQPLDLPATVRRVPIYPTDQLRYVMRFTNERTAKAILKAVHVVSAERGVDPRLVLAVIKPESTFNPKARSSGGDHGLMQIRVRYHQDRMARLGVTNIYDIEQNIRVGVDILLEYKDLARGDMHKALIRYNGGSSGRAANVLKLAANIPV